MGLAIGFSAHWGQELGFELLDRSQGFGFKACRGGALG